MNNQMMSEENAIKRYKTIVLFCYQHLQRSSFSLIQTFLQFFDIES